MGRRSAELALPRCGLGVFSLPHRQRQPSSQPAIIYNPPLPWLRAFFSFVFLCLLCLLCLMLSLSRSRSRSVCGVRSCFLLSSLAPICLLPLISLFHSSLVSRVPSSSHNTCCSRQLHASAHLAGFEDQCGAAPPLLLILCLLLGRRSRSHGCRRWRTTGSSSSRARVVLVIVAVVTLLLRHYEPINDGAEGRFLDGRLVVAPGGQRVVDRHSQLGAVQPDLVRDG